MLVFLLLCAFMISSNAKGNIALNKNTQQSSLFIGNNGGIGYSYLAVDGDTTQHPWHISCSHTVHEDNPWWAVDLASTNEISRVVLYGRSGCCPDRFSNFDIDVIKANGCTTLCHYQADETTFIDVTCPPNTVGRYVRVRLRTYNPLTICEAQVYGQSYVEVPNGVPEHPLCMVERYGYYGAVLSKVDLRSRIECVLLCSVTPGCSAVQVNTDTNICKLKRPIDVNTFYIETDAFYSSSNKVTYFIN